MASRHIAIDLGAESGRVMVGEIAESGLKLTEVHRFANVPVRTVGAGQDESRAGSAETWRWNIHSLWRDILTGLEKVVNQWGTETISSIGVDTWGVDFALLNERGELVADPVCYRDARTGGMPEKVFARLLRERIYQITGIQTMELNTLFQLASMSLGGHTPAEWQTARQILFLPDLITYWLCGHRRTEYSIASTSQILDARTRQWSPEILAAINIDPALFPPIDFPARSDSIRGTILPSVNAALAKAAVKVVAVGSHDTASAVVAVPALSGQSAAASANDWLYLSSGTWSLLGVEVDEPVLTEAAQQFDLTNEGGVGGKIRLLKNIPGLWLLQECRREWARHGNDRDYASLTALAETAPLRGIILDLSDPRFAIPGDMPAKIIAHCRENSLPIPESTGEFVRIILESLAAMYAKVTAMLSTVTGRQFKTLHIVGGGSQNHLLNQLAADATGMTVLAGPVEATALGNSITQAISLGLLPSITAGRALVAKSQPLQRFEPR